MKSKKQELKCPECHSTNVIGMEDPCYYDGVLYWICGECSLEWPRFEEGRFRSFKVVQDGRKVKIVLL